ncbi:transmembrane protein 232 [Danio rerio]|uniref:Transmembrane protein 232 n=1 Tax=Danio rerio TaxID=7955 RepID=A5WVS1_DANRE|nr:transmembrane protein 232 [Danio rerio]|eukprot:NP_001093523.1 transmembrane protein 232 [Danio rerio]
MPILKIPIKHHLGIVSQSQLEQLIKRHRKKKEETGNVTARKKIKRNPLETTEDFIEKYNQVQGSKEQEKYENLAKEFLCRWKRLAGFTAAAGKGKHVDLPRAWTQLVLLSLSNGNVRNDSLNALVVSLDHAPFNADQIPVLFHLVESVQHFLCSNTTLSEQPCSYEKKMLQLGYLVSLRLFIFQLTGMNEQELSNIYLQRLKELLTCETRYQEFPDMLFAVQLMLCVWEVLCGLRLTEDNAAQVSVEARELGVNQVLRQCLLSYHCVQNNGTQLPQVIKQLMLLRDKLQHDNWVECGLGLMILGEAAKSSMLCLQALMNLHMTQRQETESQTASWPWQLEHIYCSILINICQNSHCTEIRKTALNGKSISSTRRCSGGLITLLKQLHEDKWRLRYTVIQGLVQISQKITLQEDLRNTAWSALQKHLNQETKPCVINAATIIEGDKRLLEKHRERIRSSRTDNACVCAVSEQITRRLAHALSKICPPVQLSACSADHRHRVKPSQLTAWAGRRQTEPNTPHIFTKDTFKTPRHGQRGAFHMDLRTRTDLDLIKVVEDQWQKELKIREREEEMEKTELELRKEEEEEKIIQKRMEKVKKNTKPYELQ